MRSDQRRPGWGTTASKLHIKVGHVEAGLRKAIIPENNVQCDPLVFPPLQVLFIHLLFP